MDCNTFDTSSVLCGLEEVSAVQPLSADQSIWFLLYIDCRDDHGWVCLLNHYDVCERNLSVMGTKRVHRSQKSYEYRGNRARARVGITYVPPGGGTAESLVHESGIT